MKNIILIFFCLLLLGCANSHVEPLKLRILGKAGAGNDETVLIENHKAVFSKYKIPALLEDLNIDESTIDNPFRNPTSKTVWLSKKIYKISNVDEFLHKNQIYGSCIDKRQWLILYLADYDFSILSRTGKKHFAKTVNLITMANADKPNEQMGCTSLGWYTVETK